MTLIIIVITIIIIIGCFAAWEQKQAAKGQ